MVSPGVVHTSLVMPLCKRSTKVGFLFFFLIYGKSFVRKRELCTVPIANLFALYKCDLVHTTTVCNYYSMATTKKSIMLGTNSRSINELKRTISGASHVGVYSTNQWRSDLVNPCYPLASIFLSPSLINFQVERRYQSRLQDMKDRLEQSDSTNRSLQNYVQFLKASYASVFGDSTLTSTSLQAHSAIWHPVHFILRLRWCRTHAYRCIFFTQ